MSAITELVEPRLLLSAVTASATKELQIVAETWSSGNTPKIDIDEIRLVENEIQVFSTMENTTYWPGDVWIMEGSIPRIAVITRVKSEPVSVTVPNRELSVVHFFANLNQPRSELYNLRTFGASTLLYRRADADTDSAWPVIDIDPGAGSTVGLDFTAIPATPQGLVAVTGSDPSAPVTLYFDENPATTGAGGPRSVNRYEVLLKSSQSGWNTLQLVTFDNSHVSWTDVNGAVRTFGGHKTLPLAADVYSFSVRVQRLPVFPDGATGDNALASPWSDWNESSHFSVLPKGQQILVGSISPDYLTGATTINWGSVENAASYEVWIDRLSNGKQLLHAKGLRETEFQTPPLDPGDYRIWVKATRADGSKTTWSRSKDFTVYAPYTSIVYPGTIHDPTPTVQWSEIPRSTHYRISLFDLSQPVPSPSPWMPSGPPLYSLAYSRTVTGSSSSHTIDTPLPAGNYRIELDLYFANGASTQTYSSFTLEPVGVPIPEVSRDGVRWYAEDNVASYDVWVAYLGPGSPRPDVTPGPPNWRFALAEEVSGGTYRIPSDAPGGDYRIWLRPNVQSGDSLIKGEWSAAAEIQISAPLYRPLNIRVESKTLTWDAVPGATGYLVTIASVRPDAEWNYWNAATRRIEITSTTFRIPYEFNDGVYQIWVQSVGHNNQISAPNSVPIRIEHGTSPWTWEISNTPNSILWNPVPDAVSYELRLTERDTGRMLLERTGITSTSIGLPADLTFGHVVVQIRALRSVNGNSFQTEWAGHQFDQGVAVPNGVRLEGSLLSWDAQVGAAWSVSITVVNGYLNNGQYVTVPFTVDQPSGIRVPPYWWWGPPSTIVLSSETNLIDLSEAITAVYSYNPAAMLRISLSARIPNPSGAPFDMLNSVWSDPVDFTLPDQSESTVPVIERTARPVPSAPELFIGYNGELFIREDFNFLGQGAGGKIYRTENGTTVDLEFVERFQLRIRNLQTGQVTMLDESQLSELMRVSEYAEPSAHYPIFYYQGELGLWFDGIPISLKGQSGISDGVYEIQARVQYLPVIQTANSSRPFETLLTTVEPLPDHINVAATPWSDWSTPFEYTILPDGQNVLPLPTSPATLDKRPVFAWNSNTSNATYELWVENRATKEVAVHQTLANLRQYQPSTDLPAGQYDWWVRIVGTEGPRKGWSSKQSIEIVAPSIRTTVVAETVDATPVVSWIAANNAQSYLVTVTSVTTGRVVHQASEASNMTSHRVATTLVNDTYTFSIQAVFANGARTAPGPVNSSGGFVIPRMLVGAAPKNVRLANGSITWNSVNGATRYEVWISFTGSSGRAERVLRQDAWSTSLPLPSALLTRSGDYRIWVRAIRSESGQEFIGRWSDTTIIPVRTSDTTNDSASLLAVMSELATSGLL